MWSFRTEQQDCSKVDIELPRDSATSWDHPHSTSRALFLCSLKFLSVVRYTGEHSQSMSAAWYLSLTIFTLRIKVEIHVSGTVLHTFAGIGIHSVIFHV